MQQAEVVETKKRKRQSNHSASPSASSQQATPKRARVMRVKRSTEEKVLAAKQKRALSESTETDSDVEQPRAERELPQARLVSMPLRDSRTAEWPRFKLESKYRVVYPLGGAVKSSYGTVVAAENIETKELVAVKTQSLVPRHIASIVDEVTVLQYLSDKCQPYVLCLKEVFVSEDDTMVYIVTELLNVEWMSLRDWLERPSQILKARTRAFEALGALAPPKSAAAVSRSNIPNGAVRLQVACNLIAGLQFLQTHDIVHRDIKPENILINTNTLQIKYIDFGFSCIGSACKPSRAGTAAYLPPEVDSFSFSLTVEKTLRAFKAADTFSLGMVLYEVSLFDDLAYREKLDKLNEVLLTEIPEFDSKTDLLTRIESDEYVAERGAPEVFAAFVAMTHKQPLLRSVPLAFTGACAALESKTLQEQESKAALRGERFQVLPGLDALPSFFDAETTAVGAEEQDDYVPGTPTPSLRE
jgi:serine/threonine protein kinase